MHEQYTEKMFNLIFSVRYVILGPFYKLRNELRSNQLVISLVRSFPGDPNVCFLSRDCEKENHYEI